MPFKDQIKQQFDDWYSSQVTRQVQENGTSTEVEPITFSLPLMKELGAKWLVKAADYRANNPQIVVNGFIKAGIWEH